MVKPQAPSLVVRAWLVHLLCAARALLCFHPSEMAIPTLQVVNFEGTARTGTLPTEFFSVPVSDISSSPTTLLVKLPIAFLIFDLRSPSQRAQRHFPHRVGSQVLADE